MIERNESILSKVRLKLKDISGDKLQDDEIYDLANTVQQDLMNDTFCNEKSINIDLKADKQSYDLSSYKVNLIKDLLPSWNGEINMIPNTDWKRYRGMPGGAPMYATMFGNKLFLSPTPKSEEETITVWAYQMDVVNSMDAETEPETPQSMDDVLVWGICAEYDPNFYPLYEKKKQSLVTMVNRKHSMGQQVKQVW